VSVPAALPISFERPWLLLAAAVIPLMVLLPLVARSLAGLGRGRRVVSLVLRAAVAALLVAALAGAQYLERSDQLSVVFLLDRSRSIPEDEQLKAKDYIRTALKTRDEARDKVGLITFEGATTVEQQPSGDLAVLENLTVPSTPDSTNLAAAIRMAMAVLPTDTARRIVVLTDGNQNLGDALREAKLAAANEVPIDVRPIEYTHTSEVLFDRIVAPTRAAAEENVPLRLVLRSRRAATGLLELRHNGRLIDLDPTSDAVAQPVRLTSGLNVFTVKLPLNAGGVHRFEARFVPTSTGADQIVQNNVATGFTFVAGDEPVLILSGDAAADQLLADALRREKVQVEIRQLERGPNDLLELTEYRAVILSNTPADLFSDEQQKMLAHYVKDLGGGLVMVGGDESFGAGGWLGTDVEDVMPVTFDVKQIKQLPRGALVLIMHSCEMPKANYWSEVVAVKSVDTISRLDYFGLLALTFNKGYNWEVPFGLVRNVGKARIKQMIQQMQIGDMPDFDTTMNMAHKALVACDAAQKHVIIISDGDPSLSSGNAIVARYRAAKISVACVEVPLGHGPSGFGTMKWLAGQLKAPNATRPSYYLVGTQQAAKQLPQIFTKEAKLVRRPLIREKPFQPKLVGLAPPTEGFDQAGFPPLKGLVLTTPRTAVQYAQTLMTDPQGDPLLAIRQIGMGKTVAFTSGLWRRWGQDWAGWERFGKFWAQTVRYCMRQQAGADFEVLTRVDDTGQGRVVVEAINKQDKFLNFLQIGGVVLAGDRLERQPITLAQTGPGRYEGRFDVRAGGQYIVHLQYADAEGTRQRLPVTGLSMAYSPEYREMAANESLLQQLASAHPSGRLLPADASAAEIFAHNLPPGVGRRPLWPRLLGWAMLLFLLDVAVRRIAIDPKAASAWLGEQAGHVAGRWRSVRSERDLARLRAAREKAREAMAAAAAEMPEQSGAPPEPEAPAPDRKARFDVGDAAAAKPLKDLKQSLGGATQEPPADQGPAAAARKPPPKPADTGESTFERLRRARQRAKEELEDRKNEDK